MIVSPKMLMIFSPTDIHDLSPKDFMIFPSKDIDDLFSYRYS